MLLGLTSPLMNDDRIMVEMDCQTIVQYVVDRRYIGVGVGGSARAARAEAARVVLAKLSHGNPRLKAIVDEMREDPTHPIMRHARVCRTQQENVVMCSDALSDIASQYASDDDLP